MSTQTSLDYFCDLKYDVMSWITVSSSADRPVSILLMITCCQTSQHKGKAPPAAAPVCSWLQGVPMVLSLLLFVNY